MTGPSHSPTPEQDIHETRQQGFDPLENSQASSAAPAEEPTTQAGDSQDQPLENKDSTLEDPGIPPGSPQEEEGSLEELEPEQLESGDLEPEEAEQEPVEEGPELEWYILKVQSNREDSISDNLRRRIRIAGLEHYFGQILVPAEKVREIDPKSGKQRTVRRKLLPGYVVIQMEANDDTRVLVRGTSGVGDFTGPSGDAPIPLPPHEVERILGWTKEEIEDPEQKINIKFKQGDRVKVVEGNFEGFEGDVEKIDERSGRVTVLVTIFGRPTPVDFEYYNLTPL